MKKITSDTYVSTEYPEVNVGFFVLPRGAIGVDAPTLPRDARAWKEEIVEVAGGPLLYVVLTDAHPDRLVSAGLLGVPIVASQMAYDRAAGYTDGFWRSTIESWSRRYPEAADDLSQVRVALPEITFETEITLHKGGRDVVVKGIDGGAPGSAWVHLPERELIFAGDTVVVDRHPAMGEAPDTKAWLNTLKTLRRKRYAGTIIVPGRGVVSDPSATRPLSSYIALARRRARSLVRSGYSRPDKTAVIEELCDFFSLPEDRQDQIQRRVKDGVDRLLEELEEKQAEND